MAASLIRNPSETDPLMARGQRRGFPDEMEREIVNGGVREGRPESPHSIGLLWVLVLVLGFMLIVGVALNWHLLFP